MVNHFAMTKPHEKGDKFKVLLSMAGATGWELVET